VSALSTRSADASQDVGSLTRGSGADQARRLRRVLERLALSAGLPELTASGVEIDVSVFHLERGLGRIVAYAPSGGTSVSVSVAFEDGVRQGYVLDTTRLYSTAQLVPPLDDRTADG